jgi:hypothetical protein
MSIRYVRQHSRNLIPSESGSLLNRQSCAYFSSLCDGLKLLSGCGHLPRSSFVLHNSILWLFLTSHLHLRSSADLVWALVWAPTSHGLGKLGKDRHSRFSISARHISSNTSDLKPETSSYRPLSSRLPSIEYITEGILCCRGRELPQVDAIDEDHSEIA